MVRKFKYQLRYDIQTGTFLAWKEFLFLIFVTLLIILTIYNNIHSKAILLGKEISWIDYLSGFFMGMKEYTADERNLSFNIPIPWLIIQIGYYLIIASYPRMDLKERGYQFIIRSGGKKIWWYSKCIWVCIHTIIYYVIVYATTLVAAIVTGDLHLWNTKDVWGLGVYILTPGQLVLVLFIMPIIIAIALGILEMFLSFICNPLIALIVMLTICVASAYWYSPFLPGNYIMLIRNRWLFPQYHIRMICGIIYSVIIGTVSAVIGYYYFYRQDIYEKGEE